MADEVNLLAEEKPVVVKLADGKDYTLPPIDLTTLANIEKVIGGGKKIISRMEEEPLNVMRLFTYALLKENYPDITIDQAGHLVGLKEMPQFAQTISTILAISS